MRLDRYTLRGQEAIQSAIEAAEKNQHQQVEPEHLLLAILDEKDGAAGRILRQHGANREDLSKAIEQTRGGARITDQNAEANYQALSKYAKDLTELARQGKLGPGIGRDDEIRRTVQVLSRRTK